MCGIAGIVDFKGFDPALLSSMTEAVRHRGPDGFGLALFEAGEQGHSEITYNRDPQTVVRPVVGLGHRRLAILDLSARGMQPMTNADGTLCIVHNGEIYNFVEIRQQLLTRGYTFRTNTDTEVILAAYDLWGPECLTQFNGMWTFALIDRRRHKLFCARDRFGEKPFYYFSGTGILAFGSEIKQLLLVPGVPRNMHDPIALDFLRSGLLDHTDATFFRDIRQLPAAHYLEFHLNDSSAVPQICKYWEMKLTPRQCTSDVEACEEFRDRFQESVRLRMRSDVPVGACLSGGLDSSAVVCQARSLAPEMELHAFTAGSCCRAYDERVYSQIVADRVAAVAHVLFPSRERFWKEFERLLWHQEQPVASSNVYAQWLVMQAARQHGIPVLLDGQGGDEVLCGYQKFYFFHLWSMLGQLDRKLVTEVPLWFLNHTRSFYTWSDVRKYLPAAITKSAPVERVCSADLQDSSSGSQDKVQFGPAEDIAHRQAVDLVSTSLPALLHYEDRNAMAWSVETRLPFLDHELAEFLVNCRTDLKLRAGWSKWILRESMSGILPDSIRLRKTKLGFDTPLSEWLHAGLNDGIKDVLFSSRLRLERLFAAHKLAREVQLFSSNAHGALDASFLFRVIALESWARVFNVN
jgi:asparagine synthase (glutamine-hydrolysing)